MGVQSRNSSKLPSNSLTTLFFATPERVLGLLLRPISVPQYLLPLKQQHISSEDGGVLRQNYHEDCEALINKQINMEFYASYVYLSMSSYFSRDDQALPGFASHFAREAEEERGHGMKLMAYQSKRGGRCVFQDIAKPVTMEWGTCLEAMEAALELEKTVNESLLELTKCADAK